MAGKAELQEYSGGCLYRLMHFYGDNGVNESELYKELGIKTPAGNDVWSASTIKSILTNEKYKGCALLQKGYTADYLTKKRVKNEGAVPQYYVEDSHPAIIEPAVFDRVQDIIAARGADRSSSGSSPLWRNFRKTSRSSMKPCGAVWSNM